METLKWILAILGTPLWYVLGFFKGMLEIFKAGYKAGRTGDYTELENLISEIKKES